MDLYINSYGTFIHQKDGMFEIEIDGKIPSDHLINGRLIEALNNSMPTLIFDDEEIDCAVLVNSWKIVANKARIHGNTQGELK